MHGTEITHSLPVMNSGHSAAVNKEDASLLKFPIRKWIEIIVRSVFTFEAPLKAASLLQAENVLKLWEGVVGATSRSAQCLTLGTVLRGYT